MKDWTKPFKDWIRSRGEDYFEQGKVKDVVRNDHIVNASVEGPANSSYDVRLTLEPSLDQVRGYSCTCDYAKTGGRCKHEAALLNYLDYHGIPENTAVKKERTPAPQTSSTQPITYPEEDESQYNFEDLSNFSLENLNKKERNTLLKNSITDMPREVIDDYFFKYVRGNAKLRDEIILKYSSGSVAIQLKFLGKSLINAVNDISVVSEDIERIENYLAKYPYAYFYSRDNYKQDLEKNKAQESADLKTINEGLEKLKDMVENQHVPMGCYKLIMVFARAFNAVNPTERMQNFIQNVLEKLSRMIDTLVLTTNERDESRILENLEKEYRDNYGENYFLCSLIDRVMLEIVSTQEYYQMKLDALDETLILNKRSSVFNPYDIAKRLEYMEALNYPQEQIDSFREKYSDQVPVQFQMFESAMEKDDIPRAIEILKSITSPDLTAAEKKLIFEALIELYESINDTEGLAQELIRYLQTYTQEDTSYLRKLKSILPKDEWRKVFKEDLTNLKVSGLTEGELLVEARMFEELLDYVVTDKSFGLLDEYERILKKKFPEELMQFVVDTLNEQMLKPSSRNKYREIIEELKRLQKYPKGQKVVQDTANRWKSLYNNRSAMRDELIKAGL